MVIVMTFFDRLRQSTFLRHNAIFFVGSIAVGALNYLYYPILGRLLAPAAFGEVQALVSLFLQLIIFLTVLSLVTINIVTNYRDETRRNTVVFELEKLALGISLILLAITWIAGEQLRQFLQFQSEWPFVILAAALVVSVPFTFRTAYLRGVHRFGATSVANAIGAASKIAFSVIFVLAGLGTAGAIAGLVLAQALSLVYAARQARLSGFAPSTMRHLALPKLDVVLPELRYGVFVLLGSLGVMVLLSIDALIAKRFFDAHTAGLYAGVSTVARIIFFLTASISQVLMSSIKFSQPAHKNRQLFVKSALLLAGISAPIVLVCVFAPGYVIGLLMGKTYLPYAGLLPLLSAAVSVMSILNLIVLYFLALRRYTPAVIAAVGAALTTGLLFFYHDTLTTVVSILFYSSTLLVCLIGLWVGLAAFRKPTTGS